MRQMITILTLLIFCGVMIFSAPLFGGERAKSLAEPTNVIKQTDVQQVKVQEQTISSRISFYISKFKTLLRNWFEPKEPVVDDKPCLNDYDPHKDDRYRDNGWDEPLT